MPLRWRGGRRHERLVIKGSRESQRAESEGDEKGREGQRERISNGIVVTADIEPALEIAYLIRLGQTTSG